MAASFFKGKTILITGATGSIGSEILRQLLQSGAKTIRLFSRDEHKQFLLQQEMGTNDSVRYFLGDVRDYRRLLMAMEDVDFVFHCAAYKHVPFCEYNSFEAVKTNVVGTQNVIDAARTARVQRVLLISTDKAASPLNVMGGTKLLAERLMVSAMLSAGNHPTKFSSVRFGNVIGSRGSVLPTFCSQVKAGGPVTITDPNMTRFIMSISQAVTLTFDAMEQMEGGELFVLKMPVVRLGDLAETLIEELSNQLGIDPKTIERKIIGARPGEKLQESLMTAEEATYARETKEMFILRSPLKAPSMRDAPEPLPSGAKRGYSSTDSEPMKKDDLRKLVSAYLEQNEFAAPVKR